MFEEVGTKVPVEKVCEETGIKNYNSLKAMFSYIRRADHAAEGSKVDVRIEDDYCVRVK